MNPETLGGIAGAMIVAYYLGWRVSMFRDIFHRCARMLRHLRETES
jgi:hypothetical protein